MDEACQLLRYHILVINDSLDILQLTPNRTSRNNRNYADVFSGIELGERSRSSFQESSTTNDATIERYANRPR